MVFLLQITMVRKAQRLTILMVACGTAGVFLGGAASWAESQECFQVDLPSSQCLQQRPGWKTLEGMSMGLVAGVGAALGATWQGQ